MILAIISKDILTPAKSPHKGRRFDLIEITGVQIRKLAVDKGDGRVFGFIIGDENADERFKTWSKSNGDLGQIVKKSELISIFGENWQDKWLFAVYDWQGRDSTDPLTLFEEYVDTEVRDNKAKKIDRRTCELIGQGFEYPDGSGQRFSLSTRAQIKWMLLYTGRSLLQYPVTVTTIDEKNDLQLEDADGVETFFAAMLTTINGHVDGGRAVKNKMRGLRAMDDDEILGTTDDR